MTDKLALDGGPPISRCYATLTASDLDDVVRAVGKVVNGYESG